jgi:hypothetical protein
MENNDFEDELFEEFLSATEGNNTESEPRTGRWWVRKHNHEILVSGEQSSPEPDNSGVVLRRYFSSYDEAIESWGRFKDAPYKKDDARAAFEEQAIMEGATAHEFFYVEPSRDYLAVVFSNSGHGGRAWLRKTEIHLLKQVKNSTSFTLHGKPFFRLSFHDARQHDTKKQSVCKFIFEIVPLSGICPCGNAECEYSGEDGN